MSIWLFLVPALALSAIVVALSVLGLRRGARIEAAEPGQRREMRIYRDQLKEIERDRARGLIAPEEAERLRAETARRLLDADKRTEAEVHESPASMRLLAMILVLAVPLGAAALYWVWGAPGYPDLPLTARYAAAETLRAQRPDQATLEAQWQASPDHPEAPQVEQQYLDLMAQLRRALEDRPNDPRGLRLLAVNEGNIGNFAASADAWIRLIDVQGEDTPVTDMVSLAEAMISATGGGVSPEAEVVLQQILQREPRNEFARFALGLSFLQTGREDLAFRLWRGLVEDGAPDAPWMEQVRATMPELARIAGVRYTLPPVSGGGRGPSAADVEAASEMTAAERQDMIGGMVEGLASRLANSGGPAEDWARLIGALGVLGQQDRARAIWSEARLVFADDADGLALIDQAARAQGFTQ